MRHPDHVDAPLAVDARLGTGGELRPLDADVGAAVVDGDREGAAVGDEFPAQPAAERVGEGDVRGEVAVEEGRGARLRSKSWSQMTKSRGRTSSFMLPTAEKETIRSTPIFFIAKILAR
jgi:hypothetical protein